MTRLIQLDDQFKLFAESCTWPDNPKQRSNEHYINVPRDFRSFTTNTCPMASKCLFTAIANEIAVLVLRFISSLTYYFYATLRRGRRSVSSLMRASRAARSLRVNFHSKGVARRS